MPGPLLEKCVGGGREVWEGKGGVGGGREVCDSHPFVMESTNLSLKRLR